MPVSRHLTLSIALLLAGLIPASIKAEVRLPNVLSSHAVLQRDQPIHIWGWADPGEAVTIHFHDQNHTASADDLGKWSVWLKPEEAGGPYTLTAQGKSGPGLTHSDLLVGDVWVASGQSNMEMPLNGFPGSAVLKNAEQEIANANLPTVRLLRIEHTPSYFPKNDVTATWTECNPQTAAEFSAVAYFFGRDINTREHVPIGLIDSTWGGTPVEAWMSMDGIGSDAGLMPMFASWAHFSDDLADTDLIVAREKREDAAAEAAHQPKPDHPWHPDARSWEPANLYNGMIAPLVPYTIKGVIWYQGETNSALDRAPYYTRFFSAMIQDWRTKWGEGNFPFLYVQISNFYSPQEDWGQLRDKQRRTLAVANTAMAVTLDIGSRDNVHPPDKQTVGARLALAARALVYGEPQLEYSGPLFRTATVEGSSMRVWFDHAKDGLAAHGPQLEGFEIAGADGKFVPATAKIDGSTVVVQAASISQPQAVRYAWQGWTDANLFNKDGLPASTFTSE
ncbi:sialate O-acetylesterase [Alloacidobacterium sp.]|uniref:sialate O-acetylesterase n=1 Tax=Alloacidobacterium sp. TaxID=2951999 RepID=UPI002D331CFD|nr:sialate O-acetylesterase [Alloacidobacterium sp.]HYK36010.1 sialate O-acetylesterase [Alloacidobacterium sp.]